MLALVLLTIVSATIFAYAASVGWIPAVAKFLPEALGGIVLIGALAIGLRNRFRHVRPQYWLIFGAVILSMAIGVVTQAVGAGPVFAGIRTYVRAIPMFFLPGVYSFAEKQVLTLLRVMLLLCLVQLPLAVYQRMQPSVTGDAVTGTFPTSGMLSLFLICAASVLTAAYVRRQFALVTYLLLLLLVLAPTTINETKATLVVLPFGLALPLILGSQKGTRARNIVIMLVAAVTFLAVFVPLYNWSQEDRKHSKTVAEFFLDEKQVSRYMETDAELGVYEGVGRIDAIRVPFEYLAKNPFQLIFGLGIGNASRSAIGMAFEGKYGRLFEPFVRSSATRLVLETGLLGLGLVYVLLFMIFRDALLVGQRDDGWLGVIALGWSGVTAVLAIAMFYADLIAAAAISYPFWFFSGLISARRMQLVHEDARTRLVVRRV